MASNPIIVLFLLSFMLLVLANEATAEKKIGLGISLLPQGNPWLSSNGRFAFGFYPEGGDGYAVGIWLVSANKSDNTVVWTANRDDPPVSSSSTLQLTTDGLLLRQGGQDTGLHITSLSKPAEASSASMLDSGNFVIYAKAETSSVIWQSFDHPTDTILGEQSLTNGNKLVSSMSKSNHSTGSFCLSMQGDDNLVAYPVKSLQDTYEAYWASGTYNTLTFKYHLYLNKTGSLLIRKDSNLMAISALHYGSSLDGNIDTIYRATLDVDGVFRLYAHDSSNTSSSRVVDHWPETECQVKGFCGFNSYCTFDDEKPFCKCLPGFDYIDPNQNTLGCKRNFSVDRCSGEKVNATFYSMVRVDDLEWTEGDRSYFQAPMSHEEECSSSCFADCNCWAAYYDQNGVCMKQQPPFRYAKRKTESSTSTKFIFFFKVGNLNLNDTLPPRMPRHDQPPQIKSTSNKAIVHIILVISTLTLLLCSTIGISSHLIYKTRVLRYKRLLEIGDFGLNEEVALRRFSYSELKRATNGFKQELGKGSFGAVYKGALYKGKSRRLIAVKRLEKLVEEGEREFQAEMRAIGKTHHRNLVRLLGFCADGPKRLLVYEFMSNGSLGNLIFGDATRPDWNERVRIALDIARGILYLHEECEAPIIHCDIKPQNILMDEFWTAKISDFGLAKLLMPDQTRTFTGVRGTRGYLAPEWQKNTPITVKADVYSYGIVLLETICCRRNIEVNVSEPQEILLSGWAYKCFIARELHRLVQWEAVDKNVLENMVKVALWCIQDEPALRPSMKSAVLMLEGITDVAIPPCPSSNAM